MSDIFRDYSFGGWLREFRVKREITLRQAATRLKMDPANFSRLERSEAEPPKDAEKIRRIAKELIFSEAELNMLLSTAFQHHLSKLKERFK